MAMLRKALFFTVVLLIAILGTVADSSLSSKHDLTSTLESSDVHEEFVDFYEQKKPNTLVGATTAGGDMHPPYDDVNNSVAKYCSTWCKIKKSFAYALIGLLLVCISPCLIFYNEGRHVNELTRIDFCKNNAIIVDDSDVPSDENTGQLIYFTGPVSVGDDALKFDKEHALNITQPLSKALSIRRSCLIYQKFEHGEETTEEDTFGAGETTTMQYTVREDWSRNGPQPEQLPHLPEEMNSRGFWDSLIEASGSGALKSQVNTGMTQEQKEAMDALKNAMNTADFSVAPNAETISSKAHVGGFGLSKYNLKEHSNVFLSEWLPVPPEYIPTEIDGILDLSIDINGDLSNVENNTPKNGDIMIKYEYALDGFDASFIVEQCLLSSDLENALDDSPKYGIGQTRVIDEKCCGNITNDLGLIWMVRRGKLDLPGMINLAKTEEQLCTQILRFLFWIMLVFGWSFIFGIFSTALSTIPIIGTIGKAAFFIVSLILGTVCCCGVTALAYVRYRPVLALGILALAGGITGIIIWQVDKAHAKNDTRAPTMAPTNKIIEIAIDAALNKYSAIY